MFASSLLCFGKWCEHNVHNMDHLVDYSTITYMVNEEYNAYDTHIDKRRNLVEWIMACWHSGLFIIDLHVLLSSLTSKFSFTWRRICSSEWVIFSDVVGGNAVLALLVCGSVEYFCWFRVRSPDGLWWKSIMVTANGWIVLIVRNQLNLRIISLFDMCSGLKNSSWTHLPQRPICIGIHFSVQPSCLGCIWIAGK